MDVAPRPLLTLKTRGEFLAAARGRRANADALNLQARRRAPEDAARASRPVDPAALRVGFTCSKKVGNAVARNRAKRRLRAAARAVLPEAGRPGWDYVLIGRAGATGGLPFDRLLSDLRALLARVHGAERGRPPTGRPADAPAGPPADAP